MRPLALAAALLALSGCGQPAPAPEAPAPAVSAGGHDAHRTAPAAGPAARAYDEAMTRMHAGMGVASADPDESFMRMMIPHHQGAIDMARIQLAHGKDAEARQLAETIIATQQSEIDQIQAWLARRGAR